MTNYYPSLNNKKLEQFVNRYEEEFSSKILLRQLLANIFSPQKRREIILKNVIKERIYTSEIDNFTLADIQELENHLKRKIKRFKKERINWFFQNLIYATVVGVICGVLTTVSKLNLLWILPLFVIYIIDVFKKNNHWTVKIANYTMLFNWVVAYKLRRSSQ